MAEDVIENENLENENLENEESGDETDYRSLYEQEKAEREEALESVKKWKERAKTNYKKVNEKKSDSWIDQDTVKRMVDESVGVVKFYSENKDANQYQSDIEELVAKGIERDKAFRYVIAEKDPSLLLDDAKKAQLNGNTALTWVPSNPDIVKNPNQMSDEELAELSDEEFDKLFPTTQNDKKFFAQ